MTPLPPDLGVVVVAYGDPALLERNLVELGRQVPLRRVVIVDNFSGLAEREATTAVCEREGWTLLAPGLDLGFAAAVNAGVRLLRSRGCRLLLVLDPAVRIDEPALSALALDCASNPQRLVSPRILRPNGTVWFGGGTVDIRRGLTRNGGAADSAAPAGWLSGACLMIHAGLWDWLDGFDESYFLHWEDVDLSWRCVAAGGSLAVREDIWVVREECGQGPALRAPLQVYSACRNRLAFAARHLSRRHLIRWLLLSPVYAMTVLRSGTGRGAARSGAPLVAAAVRGTGAGAALAIRTLTIPLTGSGSYPPVTAAKSAVH
ncbi:glycosyltransferase family 2 protein [Cryobacterium lactosi]|uniref:glycosyltransferase family 2 protein n=1 Tax=Cryobacterium lactosi TaxID=1259202 RepID=UPI00141AD0A8|nr:glycosyltransferase [Cryobacterium lactosi]